MSETNTSSHLRQSLRNNAIALFQWLVLSVFIGNIVGFAGVIFHIALDYVSELFSHYPQLLYLMPLAGLVIIALYKFTNMEKDKGTESVILSVRSGEAIPLRMAPLIFASTLLTHLTGGSAGREGAALQLGGSIANYFGHLFKLDENDRRVMTMCGMATGFSALFGTPLSAAVFSMEIGSVGIMYYAALVPCILGALTAQLISRWFGILPTSLFILGIPEFFTWKIILSLIFLGVACGATGNLFCRVIDSTKELYEEYIPNPWVKVFVGALIVISLTLLIGNRDYNGAGMNIITQAVAGQTNSLAFLIKMFLTALTLTAGFRGGEIVPSFFIGSTLGCLIGPFIGLDPSFAAAVGLVSVFCAVTNAPMASIFMAYELFGGKGLQFIAFAIAVTFMTSGYRSLYHQQRIVYSKTKGNYINAYSIDNIEE